jgi:L-2-hydroxyglutarate oxidase
VEFIDLANKILKYDYDVIVVGGGIVGCATAMQLLRKRPGTKLLLIEKEDKLGQHQSGNNSGVIHSGLYYKPGSLKAINCRKGYQEIVKFCRDEDIPHDICGKVVVASDNSENAGLEELYRRGIANNLQGIRRLTTEDIQEIEPSCVGQAGIFVPETGIVNYGALTIKYGERLLDLGAEIVFNHQVVDLKTRANGVEVVGISQAWTAKTVITCAGVYSDRLARKTDPNLPLRIIPFRGEYYKLKQSSQHLVNNLIYPVPDPAFPFLGVHFTRLIGGGVECGPNAVLAFGREAYRRYDINLYDLWDSVSWRGFQKVSRKYWRCGLGEFHRSFRKTAFVQALQKLVPEIEADDLEPGGAGIRAQACDREGNLLDDFDIRIHGHVIHVCNAPSPAATASLAIGAHLAQQVDRFLN